MLTVLRTSWPLLLGVFLLMIGNGLQGSLLGLRGEAAGFSTVEMSSVMSAYFVGFLFSSRLSPILLRRVGHVRVFAALGALIAAILILYPVLENPVAWTVMRLVIGFCYCGVYITAESWLNDTSGNETRGKALSLYMIAQMLGLVLAQYLLVIGDVAGFVVFIIPSVLVSLSFAPVLLSASQQTPAFAETRPLPIAQLFRASPLACVGKFLMGAIFAALFAMLAVYGVRAGLSVAEISTLIAISNFAPLLAQYPIGWLSDRMDRRLLIAALAALGAIGAALSFVFPGHFWLICLSAAAAGGASNPLYALLIAHANDYLEREDMAAASGGLLFIYGLGAIAGPFAVGLLMDGIGAPGFWLFVTLLMAALAAYAGWRMLRGSGRAIIGARGVFTPLPAQATALAAGAAQEAATSATDREEDRQ